MPAPDMQEKVAFLGRPGAWPHAPHDVRVVETHMSWVFLAGDRVAKLKKPVRTGFLDFSTLSHRALAVAEELRLNQSLARGVYLGALALRMDQRGRLMLGGPGRVVDWLVMMRRLPEGRSLQALIGRDMVDAADIGALANLLTGFYRGLPPAETTPIAYLDGFRREIAETARVLLDPALAFDAGAADALRDLTTALRDLRPHLGDRVRAGRVVEGHGDLRPEHVFLTDPPVVIDRLEFNRGLRTVDPFDEIVFLGLECTRLGADWVLPELRARLERALGDRPDLRLLGFYWRYRALVRARLALAHLYEPIPREPAKWRPLAKAYVDLSRRAVVNFRPR